MRRGRKRRRSQTGAFGRAARRSRGALVVAALLSGAVNILALTGPLYMLEVYNRVLPSRSTAALAVLSLVMLALYALSGLLDLVRVGLMGRAARQLDARLSARVFALLQAEPPAAAPSLGDGLQPLRDLDQIRSFLASSGPTALFDMPWLPLYLGVIYVMHPLLGALATAGAMLLVALMLMSERSGTAPLRLAARSAGKRWAFAAAARRHLQVIRAMGFLRHLTYGWTSLNARYVEAELGAARPASTFGALIKVARPALQSSILGLGAYLVLHGKGSPGTMVAASILVSRALAPVESAIAHWRGFAAARQAHARLTALLARPQRPSLRHHARPHRSLRIDCLSVAPPGAGVPTVRGVGFALAAGAGLGIIGPSGSGKSTLARALVGAWEAKRGRVLVDDVSLGDWSEEARGRHIGYLPQDVALLSGTIADNIARFDGSARTEAIRAAAHAAGIDEMIERLPAGYATEIGEEGRLLSAGQRQRVGLARALFGEPFLVVLDEPDASLDAEAVRALSKAIIAVRRRGGIVIVVAHRLTALSGIEHVLALGRGRVRAFGPKEAVLTRLAVRERATTAADQGLATAAE